MRKFYRFFFLFFLVMSVPICGNAAAITMDGVCKAQEEVLKCEIKLQSSRDQINGISFKYQNDSEVLQFEPDSIWSLDRSNQESVLLATKKNQSSGTIPIGTILVDKKKIEKIVVEDVDISYSCGKKNCDEMIDSQAINLKLEAGNVENATDFSWLWIIVGAVFILFLVLFLKRRKKKGRF